MELVNFYLKTLEDLKLKIASGDTFQLIKSSATLRQLLIDDYPLICKVKKETGFAESFKFKVIDYQPPKISYDADFYELPLSPKLSRPLPTEEINLENFLKKPVFMINGRIFTVRETIKYIAHAEGGIHLNPQKTKQDLGLSSEEIEKISLLQNNIKIGGVEPISRQILKIGQIIIDTLEPMTGFVNDI